MADLSFNEINIHYQKCGTVEVDKPYMRLENEILKHTSSFYRENFAIFMEHP